MTTDVSKYLADPRPGMTLDELARELNELARIRENARLAFCKRLAVVYLMVVGHAPRSGPGGSEKFFQWCDKCIRTSNGKKYSSRTLRVYWRVGFSKNPEKLLRQMDSISGNGSVKNRDIGVAVREAIKTDAPPKVIPINKLRQQGLPTDVAREVNVLMTAWEQASSQARSQFMYIVTGKRIAA